MRMFCLSTLGAVVFGLATAVNAFSLEEARRIYGETSFPSGGNVVESGGYLFMDVQWTASGDSEENEMKELSASLRAVESYVKASLSSCTNSPFGKILTGWLEPEFEFSFENVKSTTVNEFVTNGVNHKIVAYDRVSMRKLREEAAAFSKRKNNRTDAEWVSCLNAAYLEFKDPSDKVKFYKLLGCPIVNIVLYDGGAELTKPLSEMEESCREVEKIMQLPHRENSFFGKNKRLLWSSLRQSRNGFLYPRWDDNDGGRFAEAKELYSKGKNISKIMKLLLESIAVNPISSQKWGYLGGTLRVSGNHEDALVAYLQALRFDDDNKWAWKGLYECCRKCGFTENAKGLSWFMKMRNID